MACPRTRFDRRAVPSGLAWTKQKCCPFNLLLRNELVQNWVRFCKTQLFACYAPYMPTMSQIAANRRNARSSRGPKTDAGKAVAAQNSLRHGLLSQEAILPGENASDYADFADKLYVELQPSENWSLRLSDESVGFSGA